MRDQILDLLLGSRCVGCDRPGRLLCVRCEATLPGRAVTCWPSPPPAGLVRPTAVGEYSGTLKSLVNAHKEDRCFALARPLGDLLAVSLLDHVREGRPARVVLVPVPSRAAVVRSRGHDPLLRVAAQAASRARRRGVDASVARLLRVTRAPLDQSRLGAAERAGNLDGAMACSPRRPGRHGLGGASGPRVVVVDDVITTGATVREAQRALEEAGVAVAGVAVVAATRRTRPDPQSRASLPFCGDAD